MFRRAWRFVAVSTLIAGVVAAGGCAGKRTLTDADRAGLRNLPAIQVVHYATPVPSVETPRTPAAPTGNDIQNSLGGYDPTLDLARRFSGMLSRSAGLKNLRLVRETEPLPPLKDATGFQDRYRNGAVLEVWIEDWGFRPVPADRKNYILSLDAKARLMRMQDGRVLWNTGNCSHAGTGKNSGERIVLADLKSVDNKKALARFRQVMGQVADNCARQLLRDYSRAN